MSRGSAGRGGELTGLVAFVERPAETVFKQGPAAGAGGWGCLGSMICRVWIWRRNCVRTSQTVK